MKILTLFLFLVSAPLFAQITTCTDNGGAVSCSGGGVDTTINRVGDTYYTTTTDHNRYDRPTAEDAIRTLGLKDR